MFIPLIAAVPTDRQNPNMWMRRASGVKTGEWNKANNIAFGQHNCVNNDELMDNTLCDLH